MRFAAGGCICLAVTESVFSTVINTDLQSHHRVGEREGGTVKGWRGLGVWGVWGAGRQIREGDMGLGWRSD